MSLIGALSIGKQAMTVHQAAIQTTGNNISNAGNADYTRQVTEVSATPDQMIQNGVFVGTGVRIDAVKRHINEALEGRIRAALSENDAAQTNQQWLGQVESVLNELGETDLSSRLSAFFSSWSNLANKPQDIGLRQVVIENGKSLATWLKDARNQLGELQGTIDQRLPSLVKDADSLSDRIAKLNGQISTAEGGAGQANNLRDQRDGLVRQLSSIVDVKTIEQPNGTLNVYIGSEPLVMGTTSRGLTLVTGGTTEAPPEIRFKANMGTVTLKSGQLAGLLESRQTVGEVVEETDAIASSLIFELNKIHASGQGLDGFSSVTAENIVEDPTVALNDPTSGLKQPPSNGSVVMHVKDKATGLVTSTLVQVDLDGLGGNDTTLNDLRTSLDGVAGVNATINAGKLTIAADSAAVELSFSQDSSGVLASLGVNNFFTGSNARDIAISQSLADNPRMLAAAKNGQSGDNQTARLIAAMETQPIAAFQGQSLKSRYEGIVTKVATAAASSKNDADAAQGVLETLQTQRQSLSGVSLDEEAVNLMREQRAFQGAARLISTVNELMDTVLNMAR